MPLEIIVIAIVAVPFLYLAVWGLSNRKIEHYSYVWRQLRKKWSRGQTNLLKIVQEREQNQSVSMKRGGRRSSIDNYIMPLVGNDDCIIEN